MKPANWIATVACNGYEMTKNALDSFYAQDTEGVVGVCLFSNGCMDDRIRKPTFDIDMLYRYGVRLSVSDIWNRMIRRVFECGADHVLVCNNDIELHPATYRLLLADGGNFVTPVGTSDRESVMGEHVSESDFRPSERRPHPVFSCFLIRRAAWDATGQFDERFEGAYCEDGDYHLRMHAAGIESHCISVPFYHRVSGTIANDPAGAEEIHRKADANRKRFKEKWGFSQGDKEYYEFFETKRKGKCQISR